MPDQSPPHNSVQPAVDDPSLTAAKPRRKVRMMPHGPSTPDESEPNQTFGDDHIPGHTRSTSLTGTPGQPSSRHSSTSQPKLTRNNTYGRSSTASSSYNAWKAKYRDGNNGTPPGTTRHQRSSSVRRPRPVRDLAIDMADADGYARALDDWRSDDDDDDELESHPVKALVAEAVRQAATGDGETTPGSHHHHHGVDLAHMGVGQPKSLILAEPPPDAAGPDTDEGRERMEWQSMLASVLGGDILRGESSRIGVELPSGKTYRKALGQSLWWQIRARLRNRTEEEERRRVEQRRNRVVDTVLEEIDNFTVNHDGEVSPLEQVAYILEKLAIVESLYPHTHAFRLDKPLYNSEEFQAKVDALSAWYSVVTQLQTQLRTLQLWTGTEDLDITKLNTTKEEPLVGGGGNRIHPLDSKALAHAKDQTDDSTFVDRILKEDSLRRTFEKRIFLDQIAILQNAKQTVISHLPMFEQLGLPDFQYELLKIVSFPGRLIIEALKTRLRAAERLSDPDLMVIDDMASSFRNSIALAIVIRRQYEEITSVDPDGRWVLPESFPDSYQDVILKCIKMFFKLLHWKLKSGSKAVYFRETEVLEGEWTFLFDAAEAVEGVDLVVAESLCSLMNKLMVRVINYFENSLHVPVATDDEGHAHAPAESPNDTSRQYRDQQPMTIEQMLVWYGKILDAIKMRFRKLQRFARRLYQQFDNSAEYLLEDEDTELFVEQLQESGHFLVYTNVYEEQGTYIFAEGSLWERPADVKQLLTRASSLNLPGSIMKARVSVGLSEYEDESDEEDAQYLLLVSPRQSFAWKGAVMTLDVGTKIDFALEDSRIRLVADGPLTRLEYCKMLFTRSFIDPDTDTTIFQPQCIIDAQSHLPKVNRELKKIARSALRLSECIIESAAHVRRTLRGAPGTQDLIENWYLFASDHGHRVALHMDNMAWARFSRLLMRLAISWVSFICDNCDPTDRKTFRWTVNALEYAMLMTRGNNILHLTKHEFALLRAKVASCMTLLISHFDILGARSSIEAKKEAERLETLRRMAKMYQRDDDDDCLLPRAPSPTSASKMRMQIDRSLRIPRQERLELINALDQHLAGQSHEQHLIGRVLDEEVSEDCALVFLAASSSNISLRWQQGGFIGGGANGSVYLGFNLDSGGIMAVKEIRVQDITNSPALYKQIKDEADVMQMLSHPNIVDYYGIEVHRDRVYIFEEYCPGGSLANLLEHGRIEDEEVVMVYAWQMLQGLQYLHSKGVEHRDVKPDNILLGANSVLKYVDFGAAKVIIKGNRTMAKTRAIKGGGGGDAGPAVMNSLAGTPMYLAPEVIKGGAGALGAADIWSMGCVVLEITTGRKPWSNLDNEWAIMFHIGIATQSPPLPDPGQMSDLGIDFIQQCLTIDPNARPTASELMHHPWLSLMMELTMQPDMSPTASSVPSLLMNNASDFQSLDSGTSYDLTPQSERLPSGELSQPSLGELSQPSLGELSQPSLGELSQPSLGSSGGPSTYHTPESSINNMSNNHSGNHSGNPTEGTDSPLKTHMEEIAPYAQPLVHPKDEGYVQQLHQQQEPLHQHQALQHQHAQQHLQAQQDAPPPLNSPVVSHLPPSNGIDTKLQHLTLNDGPGGPGSADVSADTTPMQCPNAPTAVAQHATEPEPGQEQAEHASES